MSRGKITEEAESNEETSRTDEPGEENERTQLTQRMPEETVEEVDALADELGMSRNAAINMLVKQALENF